MPPDLTGLLAEWRHGSRTALDELIPEDIAAVPDEG